MKKACYKKGMKKSLRETFTELILSSQEQTFHESCERDTRFESPKGVITVCVGVRRCGKSTLMERRMAELTSGGVKRENIVMLNFADERLAELENENWNELYEAYYSLYPEKRQRETVYFCFDEIQMHRNWELFVERLRREENCELYITGSSAKLLSKEIHTALRGRSLSWELFPFSFGEYLTRKGIARTRRGTTHKMQVAKAWQNYKAEGGFPEVFELAEHTRIRMHQEYFDTLLYRDVVERYNISQPQVLRQLARRMIHNIGAQLSVNKLCNDFRSSGHQVSKETLLQYIEWMEDAYFLFCIPPCTASVSERFRSMKKVYCVDHALLSSLSNSFSDHEGQMLENMVFLALRRISPEVYYYRTKEGYEVDFLAVHPYTHTKLLVQVCADMSPPTTRKRELRALQAAMAETGMTTGLIICEAGEEETLDTPQGQIRLIPAPRFLAPTDPWTA